MQVGNYDELLGKQLHLTDLLDVAVDLARRGGAAAPKTASGLGGDGALRRLSRRSFCLQAGLGQHYGAQAGQLLGQHGQRPG